MSWGVTAVFTTIVTTLASAGATIYANDQAKDSAEDAAFINARNAEMEARNKELETAEAVKRQRERDRREKARLRAQLANNGLLTTSGTPLAILGDVASQQELAIEDAVRASNMQATAYRAQGRMGLWEAEQAGRALDLDSAGTAISAAGQVAGGYAKGSYTGLYPRTKTS